MIKAIIFDCFGVLTTDLWKQFLDGLEDQEQIAQARELNRQRDAGMIDSGEFESSISDLTGSKPREVEAIGPGGAVKNTRLLAYIKQLRERGYKIGLISNIASDWVTETFLTDDEVNLFDSIILSHNVGATKPEKTIYQEAFRELDIEADSAVFVDDVDGYVEAAKELGCKGIVYSDFNQTKAEIEDILKTS